jgi:hypothetical protein
LLSHNVTPLYQQTLYRARTTVLILPSIEQEIAELPVDFMGDRRIGHRNAENKKLIPAA